MVAVGICVAAAQGGREREPVRALLDQSFPLLEAFVPSSDRLGKPAGQVQTRQGVLAASWHLDEHSDVDQEPMRDPEEDPGGRPCLDGQRMAAPSSSPGYEVTEIGDPTA